MIDQKGLYAKTAMTRQGKAARRVPENKSPACGKKSRFCGLSSGMMLPSGPADV
ncbi:hypothetical protein [Acetobacter indonesiensis]|uniref:hypothetical protein n=1 Tax=Acetobacter indonesiensis TaxID=104101 RepID=UPI001F360B66|nr:hypothetical protein [Acetobacter indonesiensis]MCG0996007.1 hypothetical protein [Acetobacter indonesiensis]MCP1230887.1 hypothetical protein [Acetobacter indonesiensis]